MTKETNNNAYSIDNAANFTKDNASKKSDDSEVTVECSELMLSLPREKGWRTRYQYWFQGFWCQPKEIESILSFQKHFQARDSDIVIATIPKSGTTWMKALAFAIVNRKRFPINDEKHPLLVCNPHDLVPFFEYNVYANNRVPELSTLPEPRIFGTHVPYSALQESITTSKCRIVYICRNPFDTFISSWIFCSKLRSDALPPLTKDDAFDMYCKGVIGYGPFWDHMLGYWKQSLERPDKLLFLKYEDLKEDVTTHLIKLAEFLGYPFSDEEVMQQGMVEKIARLCSFEKLKELEVNKGGKSIMNLENKHLFRKAQVGDWVNHLSPAMQEKLSQVMEEKLGNSGLHFKVF